MLILQETMFVFLIHVSLKFDRTQRGYYNVLWVGSVVLLSKAVPPLYVFFFVCKRSSLRNIYQHHFMYPTSLLPSMHHAWYGMSDFKLTNSFMSDPFSRQGPSIIYFSHFPYEQYLLHSHTKKVILWSHTVEKMAQRFKAKWSFWTLSVNILFAAVSKALEKPLLKPRTCTPPSNHPCNLFCCGWKLMKLRQYPCLILQVNSCNCPILCQWLSWWPVRKMRLCVVLPTHCVCPPCYS